MNRSGQLERRSKFIRFMVLAAFAWITPATLAADDPLDLARLKGKVVVIDFWASWCAPCRQSFPWLNEMQAKYRDRGLVIIGVNVDRERAEADRFLQQTPADFKVVYDPGGTLAARYQVPGMPSSYVIGRDGQQAGVHIGFRSGTRQEREAELERLLANATADRTNSQ
ncbi:TlpA disulfide reductase family protein [Peristeroidobacter agariperforans]|uniref:TlpA disulfide reductase family protein n=1 Tax=Peristeroidobacter agariperforans TaxID=268404 RepID=UPI00101C6B5C|nr:TlpA disulfide reductase family protein [Peristeroidobacter agariperforans]